jgi:predicted secreted protein
MARRATVLAALLAAAIATVCAPALASAASASEVPSNTTVTPASDGRTITIAKGTKLTISLAANNPSTGYSWQYKTKPTTTILKFVSDATASPAPTQPPTVGAPQPRTIVYRALKTGKTKIALQYIGPDHTTVADSLSITVKVIHTAAYVALARKHKTVTPASDGKTVTISKGGKLTISLKDNNPSTGYAWKFKTRPSRSILKFVSDRTASPPQTQPPTVGAPQPRTIVYKALKSGRTKIKLQYIGPDRTTVGDSLSITVKVV